MRGKGKRSWRGRGRKERVPGSSKVGLKSNASLSPGTVRRNTPPIRGVLARQNRVDLAATNPAVPFMERVSG